MRDLAKLLTPSPPPSRSSPHVPPLSTLLSLAHASPCEVPHPPGCSRLDAVREGCELLDPMLEAAPVEGFGSVEAFMAAAKQFMVLIQEMRAKAKEACRIVVLIQEAAAARGTLDAAAASEVCRKVAVATAAAVGGGSDVASTSEVFKAAVVMPKEVEAPTNLVQEGAAEEAYRSPILIPEATAEDIGGGMRGLSPVVEDVSYGEVDNPSCHQRIMLADDSDHTALFEKKESIRQISIEEMRGKAKDVSSEDVKSSDDDIAMVIGGYAQDPYDDSGLEELLQDQDTLEKSVKEFLECFKSTNFR
uniref:Uncharacterized protein n=1 Tax=Oryza punctata TaxID=4537 RepID=A0A0E0LL49_ORYPU